MYSTQLGAGLGMVEDTRILLELWKEEISTKELTNIALESGRFPNVTYRRLDNMNRECFAPRYLRGTPPPALMLRRLMPLLSPREFEQLLYLHTCRANSILADFVSEVYWPAYAAGRMQLGNDDSRQFILAALAEGKMIKQWSDSVVRRVSGYLTGCLADFGLLESGQSKNRRILPWRIEDRTFLYLAHDLHIAGIGDQSILEHRDWALFGFSFDDVLTEFKRLALKGPWLVQAAGGTVRITWVLTSMEGLADEFAAGKL